MRPVKQITAQIPVDYTKRPFFKRGSQVAPITPSRPHPTDPLEISNQIPSEVEHTSRKIILLFYNRLHNPLFIQWLKKTYDANVIVLAAHLGERWDLKVLKKESLDAGADKFVYADIRREFANEYLSRAIKANALYEGKYPLSAALARPLLAKKAIETATKEGADSIANGFRGNDQIRLEMNISVLAPHITSISVLRNWDVANAEVIRYAKKNRIPEIFGVNNPYSISENIWGRSTECGPLENPEKSPPSEIYRYIARAERAPTKPTHLSIFFKNGIPCAIDSRKLSLLHIINELNLLGAKHAIGMVDMVEDGIVGLKSRAIYESPAASILIEAHRELEHFTSNLHENMFKPIIENAWVQHAYAGLWHDPLMQHLNAFIDSISKKVDGEIMLELYKGAIRITGRKSPTAIYRPDAAIYNLGHLLDRDAVSGFAKVFNLHTQTAYQVLKKR